MKMSSAVTLTRWKNLALLLSTMLAVATVSADELLLRDGSRILGTVVKKDDGALEFETSYAGKIMVKWDEIEEIRADEPMKVMLSNDEIVLTTAIRNTADIVTLETGTVDEPAPVELAQSEIAYIKPEDWRLGKGYKLTGRANFAYERQRGNSDTDELDFDADLTYRRLKDRFVAYAELERDKDNEKNKDVTTADNWQLSTRYHRFITKKWFYGGVLAADADDKADRELRLVAGPLVGYQFFESRPMNLRTELAITRVHEEYKNESDNNYTAAGWSIDFDKYLLDEFMQFYHRQNGLMSFNDYNDIVWNTWTGLRFPLVYGLVASTELQTEYDGDAASDADDLDTTYLLKLGYQW
jgi:putative salt-induced outer membrane protein YdiY